MGGVIRLISLGLVFVLASTSISAAGSADQTLMPQALPGCSDRCGNITIPYPFGMTKGCYRSPEFFVNCTTSTTNTTINLDQEPSEGPIPFLMMPNHSLLRVINIFLDGELEVLHPITRMCAGDDDDFADSNITLPDFFTISDTKNKFLGIGCDLAANFVGTRRGPNLGGRAKPKSFSTSGSAFSVCNDNTLGNNDDSCSGDGCGQAYFPSGLVSIELHLYSYDRSSDGNDTKRWSYNDMYSCSYGFFVEQDKFKFSPRSSFQQLQNTTRLPVVLNWEIGDHGPCSTAQNRRDFACKGNSTCVDWPNINGWPTSYICRCLAGFQGNPYLPDGCQDIDECMSNPCPIGAKCENSPGNYSCSCPFGMDGLNCKDKPKSTTFMVITSLAIGVALILLVGSGWSLYWGMKQRKYIKLKQKYFEENGGLLLQHKLSSYHGVDATRIFTAEELEKATNNYHDNRVLGKGSYGIVYKGILPDNKIVAIKKSRIAAPTQSEQFVNEFVVLSQINHRNVVRLFGCCLESEVPLLVYEFITNGTLFEHIHGEWRKGSSLVWESRLKIAAETAGALAYLHSSTFMQIIHRDVKAMNILLDENYTAKVSDFGASVLIPLDQTQMKTLVQGTLGYLDPEYLQSNQLTEKSDVYSFGVVLAELLTSKVAFSYGRPEAERNLARMFVCAMEEEHLNHILDDDIVNEGNMVTVRNVARLAYRCLRLKGAERPTMREVATELEGMRFMANDPWGNINVDLHPEDQTSFFLWSPSDTSLADVSDECGFGGTVTSTTSR